jgi:GAF domain-containing protein
MPFSTQSEEKGLVQSSLQREMLRAPLDPALDDIVRIARSVCGAGSSLLLLQEGDRAMVYTHAGFNPAELPHELPNSTFVTNHDEMVVVEDVTAQSNSDFYPILKAFHGLRFYAAAPLVGSDNRIVGLLCVMDHEPRHIQPTQRETLRLLAQQAASRLEQNARISMLERDARAKTRVEQALTVERNFVNAALDTVGSLVLVLDTAGRIVRFNRTCELISGYAFADLVGRPFWERLVPVEEVSQVIQRFESIRYGGPVPDTAG